jgi:hypothetical protein
LVYDNFEPLTVLAAASAVTDRIKLRTSVFLAPRAKIFALPASPSAFLLLIQPIVAN